jgi:hypothetical protein
MTDEEFEQLNAEFLRSLRQRNYPRAKRLELSMRRNLCRDCDRSGEFYMVPRLLWQSAFKPGVTPTGCLCLNCLERRLGRRLARAEIGDGVGGIFDGRHRLRRSERMER